MAANFDFDETYDDTEMEAEEEAPPKKRSPLRIILLVLLILVLLCVVCYGGANLLGGTLVSFLPAQVQNVIPGGGEPATIAPVLDTATPIPTEAAPEETTEPVPTQELPTPDTGELPATTEPTGEPVPPTEATVQPTEEPLQPTGEPGEATPTTEPVPGPTSTPTLAPPPTPETGPTVAITPESCENNSPPVANANGPYTAMMGKGQAFVAFEATGSVDSDGTIIQYKWDFGDDSAPETGEAVIHGYTSVGNYLAILTVTDDCNATGQDVAEVTIVGPTPPAPGDTPTPLPTNEPLPADVTLGFCYLVQYGDTLSGIAWYYGLAIQDLAMVNGVSPEYMVIAGQGLFIPLGQITAGPNAYQVQASDTLAGIARQCGLTTTALAQANDLSPGATLNPGQIVIVPLGR
ncbi:MAG: LysM peptidoglycan-binding domain-containing protein [Anaerolineae bacterium]|nr:LysM peptidoglycan-binding domain-containing protein [Anaerolineae bacterium]